MSKNMYQNVESNLTSENVEIEDMSKNMCQNVERNLTSKNVEIKDMSKNMCQNNLYTSYVEKHKVEREHGEYHELRACYEQHVETIRAITK